MPRHSPATVTDRLRIARRQSRNAIARAIEILESRTLMSASLLANPGGTPATALDVGPLGTVPAVFSDTVSSANTDDYYKFSLSATSKVQLNLTGMSDDADAILLDSSGNQLYISENVGATPESITKFLDPGTYFVDVAALKTSFSTYTLALSATPPQAADAGHTTGTAADLGTLSGTTLNLSGVLSSTYLDTYYKFTLGSSQTVNVKTSGAPLDTSFVAIEDANGNELAVPNDPTNLNVSSSLAAGTYYIHVATNAPVSALFKLTVSVSGPAIPDGGGNTQATATDLGMLTSTKVITDQVSSADPNDYWAFTVPVTESVTVTLTNMTGDADTQLQSPGHTLGESLNPGTSNETMTATLQPGVTYYVDVILPELGTANYTMTIKPSVTGPVVPDYAGNTLATARNVGTLSGPQSFADHVGPSDTNDYYKFTLNNKSNVTLVLGGMTDNANLQLLSSTGSVLASSTLTGSQADSISKTLDIGTYYVRVFPASTADTDYTLSLNGSIYDGAGNTLPAALDAGVLTGTKTYKDFVGASDSDDLYKVTVNLRSNFTATLNGLGADANLELLNSLGQLIGQSTNPGTTADSITRTLDPGVYYIDVVPTAAGDTNYTLTLNGSVLDGAGNTLATAKNLGVLTPQTLSDFVGPSDTNDYYKFNVTTSTDFSATLSGLTANADLQLLNSSGTLITQSNKTGTTADSITRTLATGTYYLRVYPVSTASTVYTLTLTAVPHDNAGNTFATANLVGPLTGTKTFSDAVTSTDTLDYYRFRALVDGNFSMTLSALSAPNGAQMSLMDAGGTTIASGASITQQLSAGSDYFVLVSANSSFTTYNLALTAPAPVNAGTIAGTKTLTGSVSPGAGDYYQFTIGSTFNTSFNLTGLSADANLSIFNASGNLVAVQSFAGDGSSAKLVRSLSTGVYYASISSAGTTNYSLAIVGPPPSDDTIAGATNIGTLNGTTFTFHNSIGATDLNDYYKFTVAASRSVTITLSGMTGDGNLSLLASNGSSVLGTSAHTGTANETITTALSAGTYYIRVYRGGTTTSTNYTLTVK